MATIDDLVSNPLVQLLLLGLATALLAWVSARRERRQRGRSARVGRAAVADAARPDAGTLPASDWLTLVNDRPQEIAHLAIFGPSGSGKTTLCQGVLAERGGKVIVIDPKPARPGQIKWGGVPYVSVDLDGTYRTIDQALRALRREVNVRLAALRSGQEPEPLTIVIDEFKSIVRECPESAPDLLLRVSDIGREIGMRLVILSQSRGVVALGVKGQGDTRENFVTITIDRQHRATLEWDEDAYPLDTAPVITHAAAPVPPARWWRLAGVGADQSGAPGSAGAWHAPDQSGPGGPAQSDAETGGLEAESEGAGETAGGLDADIIRALIAAGWSKNQVCAKLRGSKDKKLKVIDAALAGEPARRA